MTKYQKQLLKDNLNRKEWAMVTMKAATDMRTFVALLWPEAFGDLVKVVEERCWMEETLKRGAEQQKTGRLEEGYSEIDQDVDWMEIWV